jgi:hypothetical protein
MIGRYGDRWTVEWLHHRGFEDWAEYLDKLHRAMDAPDGAALSFDGMTPFHHEGTSTAEAD